MVKTKVKTHIRKLPNGNNIIVKSHLREIPGLDLAHKRRKWFSWENASGDVAVFDDLEELKEDENLEYLDELHGDFDIYEAGFTVNLDELTSEELLELVGNRGFLKVHPDSEFVKRWIKEGWIKPEQRDEVYLDTDSVEWYWYNQKDPEPFLEEFGLSNKDIEGFYFGVPLVFDRPYKAVEQLEELEFYERED